MRKKGEGFAITIIKDTWTINSGVGNGREGGRAGVLGWGWGKRQKTVLEQQLKKKKKNTSSFNYCIVFKCSIIFNLHRNPKG